MVSSNNGNKNKHTLYRICLILQVGHSCITKYNCAHIPQACQNIIVTEATELGPIWSWEINVIHPSSQKKNWSNVHLWRYCLRKEEFLYLSSWNIHPSRTPKLKDVLHRNDWYPSNRSKCCLYQCPRDIIFFWNGKILKYLQLQLYWQENEEICSDVRHVQSKALELNNQFFFLLIS